MKALRNIVFLALAALTLAGGLAFAQTSPCSPNNANCQASGGNRWIIGGTNAASGTLEILTGGSVKWGSTTFRPARGETALDGSNPTPVATGLTSIVACAVSIKTTAAPGVSTTLITYDTSTATLNLYGWKPTNSSTTTMIASTSTDTVGWVCFGT